MRIAWVLSTQPLETAPSWLGSSLASYRYRVVIPAKHLKRRGHHVFSVAVSHKADEFKYAVQQMRDADVAVFGKMFDLPLQVRLLKAARESGIPTVVDVCDDHLSDEADGDQHRTVVASGDAVSVSSRFLAARVAETTGRQSTVIMDPYEGGRGEPKWAPGTQVVATWFGHPANLTGLAKSFDQLKASGIPMHLIVVTRGIPEVIDWCRQARASGAPRISLEFREWSLQVTARALRECDLVLLPIQTASTYYLSKGPNRMVESLWAGRFVVAQRLPAYEDFGKWAWVGDDIMAGLVWAMGHAPEIAGRVARAQDHIARNFSPEVIAEAWDDMLAQVNERRAPRTG